MRFSQYIMYMCVYVQGLPLDSKESPCKAGDLDLFPGLGRSSGVGTVYPLQYFCLENYMGRGAQWATVHVVIKSQTQLSK